MFGAGRVRDRAPTGRGRHRRRAAGDRAGAAVLHRPAGPPRLAALEGAAYGRPRGRRPVTDLLDARRSERDVTRRLGAPWAGRPVIIGPAVLAGVDDVRRVVPRPRLPGARRRHQPRRRAGPGRRASCEVVMAGAAGDRLAHRGAADSTTGWRTGLPDDAARRRSTRSTRSGAGSGTRRRSSPPTSRSTAGRSPVVGPRRSSPSRTSCSRTPSGTPRASTRAPYRIVDLADDAALDAATAELASELGAVWSGDARDGFNGGGNYVRWVRDDARPGRGRGVLPAALRPGPGDAVPRGRAVLDPRVRAARRHRRAAAGGDRRCCATRRRARFVYSGLGHDLGPAGRRPRGDARTPCAAWASTCSASTATAARSASTACSPPTASGPPSSTPGCRPARRR